jgi:hypothetical protein
MEFVHVEMILTQPFHRYFVMRLSHVSSLFGGTLGSGVWRAVRDVFSCWGTSGGRPRFG